jgi:transposase InsO family protein
VSQATAVLCVGARVAFDGELFEVVGLDGRQVTIRSQQGHYRTVTVAWLAGQATVLTVDAPVVGPVAALGPALGSLSAEEQAVIAERAAHIREVLTGYRAGSGALAQPGEPRPQFAPTLSLQARYQAKAAELGVGLRTLKRWVAGYRQAGEAGLVDARKVTGRGSSVDPRWEQTCRLVVAEHVGASTPTAGALLARVDARLEETYGSGVVPRPSQATAYRHLARLTKGTGAVSGPAKARRSIAERPKGVYGRLRAMRPGEYVILDTQSLDVFAMEPVTCRWLQAQLTVAQDLFTRCILGLRVTPVSTKAVDVAGVLYQTVLPMVAPEEWPAEACWPYHGVPQQLVLTETLGEQDGAASGRLVGVPVCPPETLVVDHGKVFVSAHVLGVCARLGISVQPAIPKKATDKPTVERFFRTLREGLIQHLPGYKGPDIYSRGATEWVEDAAFFFLHELEDVIREWVALVYHRAKHDGLAVPEWPGLELSPNEMFEVGVAKAGLLRVPSSPELVYDFLATQWRTIQHYGVEVDGLRYNGPALDAYRNAESPYGGVHRGKWPFRVNPDDVRYVWFQDPADNRWHRLEWEHAPGLGAPFSGEAARYARRLAARQDRWPDAAAALADLLGRWDAGMVSDRRERRMALRLGAERAALPTLGPDEPAGKVAALPSLAGPTGEPPPVGQRPEVVEPLAGDDDDGEELFDDPDAGDFYADAFEVIE